MQESQNSLISNEELAPFSLVYSRNMYCTITPLQISPFIHISVVMKQHDGEISDPELNQNEENVQNHAQTE